VEATAARAASGVDASFSGWLDFGDGLAASFECSFDAPERQSLEIVGRDGAVLVDRAHTPGLADTAFTLRARDGRCREIVAGGADPYRAMIEHVHARVRHGHPPSRSVEDAIAVLSVLDELRAAAGLSAAPRLPVVRVTP
jgi:predicted dehydrogenase